MPPKRRKRDGKEAPKEKRNEMEPVEKVQILDNEENGAGKCSNAMVEFFNIDEILKDREAEHNANNRSPDLLRCSADDLSTHVPLTLKQKIVKNEYINLALLLKGGSDLEELCSGGTVCIDADTGKLEIRPKKSNTKITSIEQWTDAFLIFMSIYQTAFPDKVSELLKYIVLIRESAKKNPSAWLTYDEQFRMRQACSLRSWGQLDSELYLRVMVPSTNNGPTYRESPMMQRGVCREFNKGFCKFTRCRYRHVCELCGSFSHGMMKCGKPTFKGGNFRSFQSGPSPRGRGFNFGRGK